MKTFKTPHKLFSRRRDGSLRCNLPEDGIEKVDADQKRLLLERERDEDARILREEQWKDIPLKFDQERTERRKDLEAIQRL